MNRRRRRVKTLSKIRELRRFNPRGYVGVATTSAKKGGTFWMVLV